MNCLQKKNVHSSKETTMAKIKKQTINEISSKARSARAYSGSRYAEYALEDAAINLSRGKAKGIERVIGRSPSKPETKAARMMQNSRAAELSRSEARAKGVTKRAKAKAEEVRTQRALTGNGKKAAPKAKKK
jgi:hypothetical protein